MVETKNNSVSDVMSLKRWESIKRFIHFADNETAIPYGQPGHSKIQKIKPLIEILVKVLKNIPKEESLCVDEQIVPFKGRSGLKQYNPNKPHKWGYKIFVLSGVSGFSYDFEIFTGAADNKCEGNEPDLGASSNVVVRLARTIPKHVNYRLYFDNWFTSTGLVVFLSENGIQSLGTVRKNRLKGCEFPDEKSMRLKGRGTSIEKICTVNSVTLSAVHWYDNKCVTLLSDFVGSEPPGSVRRFSRKENVYINIPCPKIVQTYGRCGSFGLDSGVLPNSYSIEEILLDNILSSFGLMLRKCLVIVEKTGSEKYVSVGF